MQELVNRFIFNGRAVVVLNPQIPQKGVSKLVEIEACNKLFSSLALKNASASFMRYTKVSSSVPERVASST